MARRTPSSGRDLAFDPVTIGTDEAATEGVTVVRSESGRVAFVPRSVERLEGEALELTIEAQEVVLSIREGQERLDLLVEAMREVGVSWAAIGWCVGVSPQGAQQRWGRDG